MNEEKILSIITINYNGLKDTCELMDTLPLDDASIEVIVVDNASREDEASVIAALSTGQSHSQPGESGLCWWQQPGYRGCQWSVSLLHQ